MIEAQMVAKQERRAVHTNVYVHGSLFQAFAGACESLRLLLNAQYLQVTRYMPDEWYSVSEFNALTNAVACYDDTDLILQHIGAEMISSWFHFGGGKGRIASALDFIRLQTGNEGFSSVVKGPVDECGKFQLELLNVERGIAIINSSTPFPMALEIGILQGGLKLLGDLLYSRAECEQRENKVFTLYFVTDKNRETLSWADSSPLTEQDWTVKNYLAQLMHSERFAHCLNSTLNKSYREMESKVSSDALTGLYNRATLLSLAEKEFERSMRRKSALCVIYIDIDHFKRINDNHGHHAGDEVISGVGDVIRSCCRLYDIAGRIGGDEFVLITPDTCLDQASTLCRRLHDELKSRKFRDSDLINITVSVGVSQRNEHATFKSLLRDADMNLLRAKRAGRNKTFYENE